MKTILSYLFGLSIVFIISNILNSDKETIYFSFFCYSFIMILNKLNDINKNLKK